jgi:hypothetical protein
VEQGASRVGGAAVVCSVGAGCGAAVAVQALLGERGEWRARRGFWWRQLLVGGCGWRGGGVSEGSELEATLLCGAPGVVGPCLAYLWEAFSSGEAV